MTGIPYDPGTIRRRFDRDAWGWKNKYRPRKPNPFRYDSKRYRRKHVLDLLGPGPGRLLDLGCGPGSFFDFFRHQGYSVVGVDFSTPMVRLARQEADWDSGDGVLAGNALALPFRDRCFEALTAVGLLEYLPDDEGLLREIRRVLKPGGRFVLTVRNSRCLERRLWKIYGRVFKKSFDEKHFYREHDTRELEAAFRRVGFMNIRWRYSHFYPLPWPWSKFFRPLNALLGHPMEFLFSRSRIDFLGSVLVMCGEAGPMVQTGCGERTGTSKNDLINGRDWTNPPRRGEYNVEN